MSALNVLDIVIYLIFIAIGLQSLIDYLRHRDAMRRDVAALFASLGVAFLIALLALLLGRKVSAIESILTLLIVLAEPYFLLRLVRYLRHLPAHLLRVTLGAMILSSLMVFVLSARIPIVVDVLVFGYVIGFNGYAMLGFIRGALTASGIAQHRLRFAAAGSSLFALFFAVALLVLPFPQLKTLVLLLVEILALLCISAFYVGFAPPRWLQRIWQLAEAERYQAQITHISLGADVQIATISGDLCQVVNRAVGGMAAGIVQKDPATHQWTLVASDHPTRPAWNAATTFAPSEENLAPHYVRAEKHASADDEEQQALAAMGADTLLLTPIRTTQGIWGLLLVFLRYGSLFIEDDLLCVTRLAEQSAIVLANGELIANLHQYAASLEQQKNQLTAANKELDAFSYSVSHDLRAPLRAVDGFSQVLLEDYETAIDATGQDYLHRIRAESQRMGQLIDDLIGLSRLTRTEMTQQEIDLSAMVRSITADIQAKEPDRAVEFAIQAGLTAYGDAHLLQIVLQNLVNNAWKFTAKQPQARIEFGCTTSTQTKEYYLRDNGAGFDMAYVNKLFGPFQRLHAMEEFAGTGIGLATVQRIMLRHGGSVRAEGAIGEGATFYFRVGMGPDFQKEKERHEPHFVS